MQQLDLQVRYFQDSTPLGVPCREENFVRRQIRMSLPLAQTALVLVDMWNDHFNDSWLERAAHLTGAAVVPVLEAARAAALKIIHAPSPEVAAGFPQLERHQPPLPEPVPQWPPADFRARQGDYAAFRGPRHQPPGIGPTGIRAKTAWVCHRPSRSATMT